jgi:hypothetical protein
MQADVRDEVALAQLAEAVEQLIARVRSVEHKLPGIDSRHVGLVRCAARAFVCDERC